MEDKVKHRIVGAVVIAAFLVILVPALIKKVSWHSETSENKSRIESSMSAIEAPQSFQTSEIAQVSLDNPASQPSPTTQMPADTTVIASIPEPIESQAITAEGTAQPATATMAATPATPATAVLPTQTSTVAPEPVAASAPMPIAPTVITAPPPAPVKAIMVKPVVTKKKVVVMKKTAPLAPVKVIKITTVKKPIVVKNSPVTAGMNNYCLQMGAFANPTNANLLVQRLKAHGFSSAHSTTMTLPSGITVHKVSLCKKMTPADVIALRNRLMLLSNTPIIVVRT